MQEYTFRYGPFCFKVNAADDKDAVEKARRAIEESYPEDSLDYLKVDLTAGGFLGCLYIDSLEISSTNIIKREITPDLPDDVPF